MGFALLPREGQTESIGEKVTVPRHSGTGPRPCGPVKSFQIPVSKLPAGTTRVSAGPLNHKAGRLRKSPERLRPPPGEDPTELCPHPPQCFPFMSSAQIPPRGSETQYQVHHVRLYSLFSASHFPFAFLHHLPDLRLISVAPGGSLSLLYCKKTSSFRQQKYSGGNSITPTMAP